MNHPTSKLFFEHIPENRRSSPKSQQQVLESLAIGCNKKLVQTKLLQEKNKCVTLRHLTNLKAKLKNVDDDSLPKAVELLETQYGATVRILEEDQNFKGLFFVTEAMKLSMSKWFHIVFIDGTYKLLKNGLTLMLLIVQDSNALSAVVAVALLASEDRPTFTWLLQSFKDLNTEACAKINCFMSDKDLLEREVIKEVFPGKPVYICRFHTLRTFSRTITSEKLKISAEERMKSLALLQEMVYSSSELMYDKLYSKLVKSVPPAVLEYFNANWHCIREDWTTYSMVHGNLNNITNNRLESMNANIKKVVSKNSSLIKFFENFFKWLQSHNLGVKHKCANTFMKQPVQKLAPGSDQQLYRNALMPVSAARVIEQIDLQVMNITCTDKTSNECIIRSEGINLKVTPLSCECPIWTSEFVPCRHIFSVRRYFNLPLFSSELCQDRCTKQYAIETLQSAISPQQVNAARQSVAPSISKVISKKPVTATAKRKKITPIIAEISNLAIASCGTRFNHKMTLLKDICEAWKKGCEVTVITSSDKRNNNLAIPTDETECAEINNNLSRLIVERCSLSNSDIVELQDVVTASSIQADSHTPRRLTVTSDSSITNVKMPPTITIFGRPSRYLATTTGVKRRNKFVQRFNEQSDK